MQQQSARLPLPQLIRQDQWLLGIPIVRVMRGELVIPFQLTRLRRKSDYTIGVKVVSFTLIPVVVRAWISRGPVNKTQLLIVRTCQPRGAAPMLDSISNPGL